MKSSELRIIGGKFKRKKIIFNSTNVVNIALRPTLDRVRETVFNWLDPYLLGANCLDLFAGSGIFSFEALSRGANFSVAIEIDLPTCKDIIANQQKLQLNDQQFIVLLQDVLLFLKNPIKLESLENNNINNNKKFNIVFLDPPYTDPEILLITLNQLINNKILSENAKIYFECYQNSSILEDINFPKQLKLSKFSKAGKVKFYLLDYVQN